MGKHPESGKVIVAGLGRFGPYLLHDGKYTSIPAGDDVYTIGINRAVDVLASKRVPKGAEPLKSFGAHPDGGGEVQVFDGRYGAYVKHGKINATLPKGTTPENLTLEEALALIAAKAGAAPAGTSKKKVAAKAKAPAKSAAKKAPEKKAATKKKPATKK